MFPPTEASTTPYLGKICGFNNSLKCVHATTFGEGVDLAKCLNVAEDNPTPSLASVPLPNSSSKHSDLEPCQLVVQLRLHNCKLFEMGLMSA